jgi:prepilin-type N-terminal cleavage/methylation domain-containing protein
MDHITTEGKAGMNREPDRGAKQACLVSQAGFTVTELVVVIALVGLISVMTVPSFVSYYQAAAARADVQTIISIFNQAREVAIKQNDKVCVTMPDGSHMSLRLSNCAGTAWTGPGTDAAGTINLPPGFTITPLTSVTFDYLGAADGVQTYTMTNSTTGGTMTFSIALTGRVTGS